MLRITVIGGGVIGLTIAYELADRGHRVRLLSDRAARESVSGVAGAIWFPYAIDASPATQAQLQAGLRRFTELATQPGTGVDLRTGLLVERSLDTPRDWTDIVTDHPAATPAELPAGATGGFRLRLPMIDTPRYLDWLGGRVSELGVVAERAVVADLETLVGEGDAVVVAAGLRSAELLGDDKECYPVRGQVVRLANPGLHGWVIDDDHPDGMTYVLPRSADIVCGGTAEVGNADPDVDPDTEAAILRRCVDVVPELAGLPIVSRGVGLRPGRPSVRVERLDRWQVPVVTCYGHGGAGVTASWGSAAAVADLLTP